MSLLATNRTYGEIKRTPNGWMVTRIEPHVALRLKAIFPRIPKTGQVPFLLSGGPQLDADLDWFMQRYPLAIAAEDRERIAERKTLFEIGQAEIGAILSANWKPSEKVAFRDGMAPYHYQTQAAELARKLGRLLLMDGLGLGKTISALATITHDDCLPAAVVVQSHLAQQWVERINEFTHLRPHVIKGTTPYALPPADVYIFKYSNMAGWIDYFEQAPFKAVVFDEMQELRHGENTGKGKAARAMTNGTGVVMGLTATPIYNYGSEIHNVIEFLEPGALGSWIDFTIEWCKPGPGGKWVVKDPQALGTFMRESHLALRRTDDDVGNEMPPLNVITQTVAYDETEAAADEALARSLAQKVVSGSFTERGQASREFDALMRHTTGVAKAKQVAAFVRILLEAGQPVLLVGWHRDVYAIWQQELAAFNPALYTGSESPTQKERTKAAFISGATNLMIISLRSGAGLDGLQARCHTIVFGELDWSPQVHAQCCGRLRRPGQTRQVDAIYLHADGGSDPAVIATLGLKASQSAGIVDPLSAPADQHSDATRIRQLAELYLAGKSSLARPAPVTPVEPVTDSQVEMAL